VNGHIARMEMTNTPKVIHNMKERDQRETWYVVSILENER